MIFGVYEKWVKWVKGCVAEIFLPWTYWIEFLRTVSAASDGLLHGLYQRVRNPGPAAHAALAPEAQCVGIDVETWQKFR